MQNGDELDMLWVVAVAAGPLGMLLGLRYKAPSLIAASGLLAALILAIAIRGGVSFVACVLALLASVASLQTGYVVGLILSRPRRPQRADRQAAER